LTISVTNLCCGNYIVALTDTKILADSATATVALCSAISLGSALASNVAFLSLSARRVDNSLTVGVPRVSTTSLVNWLVATETDALANRSQVFPVEANAPTSGRANVRDGVALARLALGGANGVTEGICRARSALIELTISFLTAIGTNWAGNSARRALQTVETSITNLPFLFGRVGTWSRRTTEAHVTCLTRQASFARSIRVLTSVAGNAAVRFVVVVSATRSELTGRAWGWDCLALSAIGSVHALRIDVGSVGRAVVAFGARQHFWRQGRAVETRLASVLLERSLRAEVARVTGCIVG
jgi:hypothetical protein